MNPIKEPAKTTRKRFLVVDDYTEENVEVMAASPEAAVKAANDELWRFNDVEQGQGATVWQSPVEFYVEEAPRVIAWKRSK